MQMEVSQVRAEVDKKIAEKEEEFDAVRKNHARAIESMQASLDVEVKARSDASRGKKKAEAAVADLEMSLGIANKNYNEQQKNYRKLQAQFKVCTCIKFILSNKLFAVLVQQYNTRYK